MVRFSKSLTTLIRGIKLNEDFHFAKFRFDRQFRLVSADDFLKQLLSSETV